jgi:hypothetical protein
MKFAPLYPVEREADSPAARRALADFARSGERGEVHSHRGLLLHHILNHCVAEGIGFTIDFSPATQSYTVRRRA